MDHRQTSHRLASPVLATASALALVILSFATGPALAAQRSAAEVVKGHCARCHDAGTAGAPKPGDKGAWAPRFNRGVDALVLSAIRGHGGMPPRGGKADLTDAELKAAVLHLFNPAGPPKAPKGAQAQLPPGAGPHRVTVDGLDVYLGLVSAERMRGFPAGSPERKLHGGIPGGSGHYHVNVSVFDAASQSPVTGAKVALDVEQVGLGRESTALEPVTLAGGPSHGAYVRLVPKGDYVFVVRVRKPGTVQDAEAKFREKLE